jgi:hypothetical protein
MSRHLGEIIVVAVAAVALVASTITLLLTQHLTAPFFRQMSPDGPAGVGKDVIAVGGAQALLGIGLLAIPVAVLLALLVAPTDRTERHQPRRFK